MDRAARLAILKDPDLRPGVSVAGRKAGSAYSGRILEVVPDAARCRVRYVVLTDTPMRTGLFEGTHVIDVTVPSSDTIAMQCDAAARLKVRRATTAVLDRVKLAARIVGLLLVPLGLAAAAGYPMFILEEALQAEGLAISTACLSGEPNTAAQMILAYEATLLRAQKQCDGWLGRLAFYQRPAYREYFFRAAPAQLDSLRAKARWAGADPGSVAPSGAMLDGIPVLRLPDPLTNPAYEDTVPPTAANTANTANSGMDRVKPTLPGSDGLTPNIVRTPRGEYAVWYADRWHFYETRAEARRYVDQLVRKD